MKKLSKKSMLYGLADEMEACKQVRTRFRSAKRLILDETLLDDDGCQKDGTEMMAVKAGFKTLAFNKNEISFLLTKMGRSPDKPLPTIPELKCFLRELVSKFEGELGGEIDDDMLHLWAWDFRRHCVRVKEVWSKWHLKPPKDLGPAIPRVQTHPKSNALGPK
jgi:hypothetical protein